MAARRHLEKNQLLDSNDRTNCHLIKRTFKLAVMECLYDNVFNCFSGTDNQVLIIYSLPILPLSITRLAFKKAWTIV